jgi:hypothetical protein
MKTLNDIKKALENTNISGQDNSSSVLRKIQSGKFDDEKIIAFIDKMEAKGKLSLESVTELAKKEWSKTRRIRHTRNDLQEISTLSEKENFGQWWAHDDDMSVYSVYEYPEYK